MFLELIYGNQYSEFHDVLYFTSYHMKLSVTWNKILRNFLLKKFYGNKTSQQISSNYSCIDRIRILCKFDDFVKYMELTYFLNVTELIEDY